MTAVEDTWLIVFPPKSERAAPPRSVFYDVFTSLSPLDGGAPSAIVVEVTKKRAGHWIVVLAALVSGVSQRRIEAVIAFSDSSWQCNRLSQDGLPAFEAAITVHEDGLHVEVHAFTRPRPGDALGDGGSTRTRFVVRGLPAMDVAPSTEPAGETLDIPMRFHQKVVAPDPRDPAGTVRMIDGGVELSGTFRVHKPSLEVTLDVPELRYPDLSPLDQQAWNLAVHVWHGHWRRVETKQPQPAAPGKLPLSISRPRDALQYVPASFRFEAVDWIGFRIDLRDTTGDKGTIADLLGRLIKPLRDLDPRYAAASTTLTLDLLRYGRMRLAEPFGELTTKDWFGQHELALRIAVRRPGDARTASFVVAIWVDNPWSRYLGRELQGFDKRLAAARDRNGRLVDERGRGDGADVPLWQVAALHAVECRSIHPPVLAVHYGVDPAAAPMLDVAMRRPVAGPGASAGLLDEDGLAVGSDRVWSRSEFANVQVSPCDERRLPGALIESRFTFSKLRVGFPDGLVRLSLDTYGQQTPPAWQELCDFLDGHGGRELTLPAGDWYRIACDLRMEVMDPLGW